ncbi:MAG: hypothetical protein WC091_13515, partial [Sulfuricellaceae bacterium]
AGLHGFPGAWRRCNSSEWNNHSSSLRLALRPENRTLQPVQQRNLGLTWRFSRGRDARQSQIIGIIGNVSQLDQARLRC